MTGRPLFVSSGDLIADRRYQWALDHAARGDLVGAADVLGQTVELAPEFATAWFALGGIRDNLGDRVGAIAAWEKARDADPADHHGARLQLARLGAGEITPAMTATYVRRLFDQQAENFDQSLLEGLDYRGPRLLLEAVLDACGRLARASTLIAARSRMRHRARRACLFGPHRFSRRGRSLSEDARGSAPHRRRMTISIWATCWNS